MNATAARQEDASEPDFKPMSAEEARQFRQRNPSVSPWRVIAWQLVAGLGVAVAAWAVTGRYNVGWSAAYGALAVVIPAALFARGLMGRFSSLNPATAVFGFFMWEMVKIGLSVALLAMAPKMVPGLSWPAMLVGLVLTMKVNWVALWLTPKHANVKQN